MITPDNNNKYYIMETCSEGIRVNYGRVGRGLGITEISNKSWNSLYNSKIKKGYVDVTELVAEEVSQRDFLQESDDEVNRFVSKMRNYMKGLVQKTYKKAESVTKPQIEKAQNILNRLKTYSNDEETNKLLIELYTVIPRNMSKVSNHLLPRVDLKNLIQDEQDNLDAIKGYITQFSPVEEETSYLSSIKVNLKHIKEIPSEIKYITDQLRNFKLFEANTWETLEECDKKRKFLIHGTRNSSVLPIMEQGLKIRPSGNFTYSGKVYGNGNYYSEVASKSLNYTGSDSDKVLLIYEVITGNPFIYNGWYKGNSFELTHEELEKRGFDSTYVTAGNGLLNSEIIVYKENRQKLRYIILTN